MAHLSQLFPHSFGFVSKAVTDDFLKMHFAIVLNAVGFVVRFYATCHCNVFSKM